MPDRMSEQDEVTYRILAIIDKTTVAEQRRIALAWYARQARDADPHVAEAGRLILAARLERAGGGSNVVRLPVRK